MGNSLLNFVNRFEEVRSRSSQLLIFKNREGIDLKHTQTRDAVDLWLRIGNTKHFEYLYRTQRKQKIIYVNKITNSCYSIIQRLFVVLTYYDD